MTPNFALVLSFQTIRLLDRMSGGWAELTRADLADGPFDAAMAHVRQEAEATGQTLTCSALLPLEQVKFLTVDDSLDETGVRRAMTGATPYRLSELVIDWMQEGGQTYIAACARETLQEAEAVLSGAGFEPISLGAIPPNGKFPREVWFGPCRGAEVSPPDGPFTEVSRPEAVFGSRSGAVATGVSAPRRLSLGAPDGLSRARASGLVDPTPDRSQPHDTGLERAARAGLIENVPEAPPPSRDQKSAKSPEPLRADPAKRAALRPGAADEALSRADDALAPGAAGPSPAARRLADPLDDPVIDHIAGPIADSLADPNDPTPDGLHQEAAASLTALRAVPQFNTPQAHAEARHRRSAWPLGVAAAAGVALLGGLWWISRGGDLPGFGPEDADTPVDVAVVTDVPAPIGPADAPSRPVAQPSPLATSGQSGLTDTPVAGAAPTVEASAPERLGSVVASDVAEPPASDPTPEPEPSAAVAPDTSDALASGGALGDVLSADEARRIYAATGVWLRAPRAGATPLGPTDFTRPTLRTKPAPTSAGAAPATAGFSPRAVPRPQPVLPKDQVFALDARGVVPATVQGARTPFGALAYLGSPPGAPEFRPLPVGPMDDIPEGFSPRPRPPVTPGAAIDAALQEATEAEAPSPDAPQDEAPQNTAPQDDDQSALPQTRPQTSATVVAQRSDPDASTNTPTVAQRGGTALGPLAAPPTAAATAAPDTRSDLPVALSGLTPPPVAPWVLEAAETAPETPPPGRPDVTRAPVTGGVALTAVGGATPSADVAPAPEPTDVSPASSAAAGAVGLALLTTPLPPERPEALAPPPAASVVPQRRPAGLNTTRPSATVAVASAQVARPSGPVNRSVAARATQENVLNLRKYNLISVSGKSGSRAALVRAPTGRVSRVKVGDRLDGGQVRAIDQSSLRYLKRGKTITLRMPRS